MVIDDKAISWFLTILTGAFAIWANYRQWRLNEAKERRDDKLTDGTTIAQGIDALKDIIIELRTDRDNRLREYDLLHTLHIRTLAELDRLRRAYDIVTLERDNIDLKLKLYIQVFGEIVDDKAGANTEAKDSAA